MFPEVTSDLHAVRGGRDRTISLSACTATRQYLRTKLHSHVLLPLHPAFLPAPVDRPGRRGTARHQHHPGGQGLPERGPDLAVGEQVAAAGSLHGGLHRAQPAAGPAKHPGERQGRLHHPGRGAPRELPERKSQQAGGDGPAGTHQEAGARLQRRGGDPAGLAERGTAAAEELGRGRTGQRGLRHPAAGRERLRADPHDSREEGLAGPTGEAHRHQRGGHQAAPATAATAGSGGPAHQRGGGGTERSRRRAGALHPRLLRAQRRLDTRLRPARHQCGQAHRTADEGPAGEQHRRGLGQRGHRPQQRQPHVGRHHAEPATLGAGAADHARDHFNEGQVPGGNGQSRDGACRRRQRGHGPGG